MASQWTIPKLITWRVKDWASCFLACKIPLDVDEDEVNNNGNTRNNTNLMFKKTKREMKCKKKRSERKLSLSPPGTRHHHHLHLRGSSVSPTSASQNRRLSWPQPPGSDEPGFIVFCFDREDGNFDVMKEPEQEQDDKVTCQETEDVSCDVHDQKNEEEEDFVGSHKSSESNHSDEGRGSFAFPILGVEWMGSPVQMPKTDDLSPKKQKPVALGFQCCRFLKK